MDDIIVRPRYSRNNNRNKKKKRSEITTKNKIMIQIAASLIIFLIVWGIKSINTSFTNNLTNVFKNAFTYEFQLNSILNTVEGWFGKLDGTLNPSSTNKEQQSTQNNQDPAFETVPVDAGINYDNESMSSSDVIENPDASDAWWGSEQEIVIEEPKVSVQNLVNRSSTLKTTTIAQLAKTMAFVTPVRGTVSSPFGMRLHPIKKIEILHKGVDLKANTGVSIRAAASGTVIIAKYDSSYGNYIRIQHSYGVITTYGHCSKLLVSAGESVRKNQLIALVGSTGDATGPHLHFEVSINGKVVDPLNFIKVIA